MDDIQRSFPQSATADLLCRLSGKINIDAVKGIVKDVFPGSAGSSAVINTCFKRAKERKKKKNSFATDELITCRQKGCLRNTN